MVALRELVRRHLLGAMHEVDRGVRQHERRLLACAPFFPLALPFRPLAFSLFLLLAHDAPPSWTGRACAALVGRWQSRASKCRRRPGRTASASSAPIAASFSTSIRRSWWALS